MNDLISRQAAIDEIKEIYEWHDNVTKERIIEHFVVSRWIMESGKRDPEYHSAVYMSTLAHKPMHGDVWYRRVL